MTNPKRHGLPWSDADNEALRKLAGHITKHDLAGRLQRTVSSVEGQARKLGLSLALRDAKARTRGRGLSDEQKARIRQLAGTMTSREIALRIGCAGWAVRQYCSAQGISTLLRTRNVAVRVPRDVQPEHVQQIVDAVLDRAP